MKLRTILEDAAAGSISAGSIAGNPFTTRSPIKRRPISKQPKVKKLGTIAESALATFNVGTAILFEFDDANVSMSSAKNQKVVSDINDKVSNAFKRQQGDDKTQTTTFGLQDGDGKVIKVTVEREQAADFESRLNSMLSDTENPKEIAEVLFDLKKDYEIIDVEWNEPITEDDEPAPEEGEEDLALDAEGEDGEMDPDAEGEEGDMELDAGGESPDLQAGTVDLLQQVINLLKQETEARAANAKVATADAETKLQSIEQGKQDSEITQQQEIADMEEFEEEQKESKKNERLVQRLAKFRASKQQGGQ